MAPQTFQFLLFQQLPQCWKTAPCLSFICKREKEAQDLRVHLLHVTKCFVEIAWWTEHLCVGVQLCQPRCRRAWWCWCSKTGRCKRFRAKWGPYCDPTGPSLVQEQVLLEEVWAFLPGTPWCGIAELSCLQRLKIRQCHGSCQRHCPSGLVCHYPLKQKSTSQCKGYVRFQCKTLIHSPGAVIDWEEVLGHVVVSGMLQNN